MYFLVYDVSITGFDFLLELVVHDEKLREFSNNVEIKEGVL